MLNIPCDQSLNCPGSDWPIENFSSEKPDRFFYVSNFFGFNQPYLGSNWSSSYCFGQSESFVSQDEADIQAINDSILCSDEPKTPDPVDPGTPNGQQPGYSPPVGPEYNTTQGCQVNCPDGSGFTYTVRAGQVVSQSQYMANRVAQSIACNSANKYKICLGSLNPSEVAINTSYSATLVATGNSITPTSTRWEIVGGSLPPGVQLNNGYMFGGGSVPISGTPTASGAWQFTVKVTTITGAYMTKSYTLCVVDILSASPLTSGTVNTDYSNTFSTLSCARSPVSWQVSGGSLPPGLTLNESTGVLSGIPTTAGTYNFTILLQTAAT